MKKKRKVRKIIKGRSKDRRKEKESKPIRVKEVTEEGERKNKL